MKRFLTPLPIGIVLADLIYGFVLNVMQGLNLQQTASNQSGTLSVTPDIAFNSLQIVANGGMVCIIGFGLIVLFQLNRAVLRRVIWLPQPACPSSLSCASCACTIGIACIGLLPPTIPPLPSNQAAKRPSETEKPISDGLVIICLNVDGWFLHRP